MLMPRLEEEGKETILHGESRRKYAEDGQYTIAEANEDLESFGAICMTGDGRYLASVMIPICYGKCVREGIGAKKLKKKKPFYSIA